MIAAKFARKEFEKLSLGSEALSQLQAELEAQIANELHEAVNCKFKDIAQQLRKLGHDLTEQCPEYDTEYASWSYEYIDKSNENFPRIWLHTQIGVNSGYTKE